MQVEYQRLTSDDTELLAAFLTEEQWPYHSGELDNDAIRRQVAEHYYDSESARTFWITADGEHIGLIRMWDLGDDTPLFDVRIRAARRGRGVGTQAVSWLTEYLFTECPGANRIEATTRQDNLAMRRVFRKCGYVKEAHYRDAWPGADSAIHDAIGYAILRRDWLGGTVTLPAWNDEV
jgi:RimJ/RimL family protein N-acetyltransferase